MYWYVCNVAQMLEEHLDVSDASLSDHIRLSEYHVTSSARDLATMMQVRACGKYMS